MKKDNTEEVAIDIFQEMGNIGTGSAVTALSNMIGRPINESFPNVMLLDYDRLLEILGQDDESVLGLLFPVCGEISGLLLFVWKQDFVSDIFEAFQGGKVMLKDLDDEKLSVMKEIANIMTSAYFTAISSYTDKKIEIHAPAVSVDMAGAVVTEPAGWTAGKGKYIVCVESGFYWQDESEASHLCFMMYQESTLGFLKSLGVEV